MLSTLSTDTSDLQQRMIGAKLLMDFNRASMRSKSAVSTKSVLLSNMRSANATCSTSTVRFEKHWDPWGKVISAFLHGCSITKYPKNVFSIKNTLFPDENILALGNSLHSRSYWTNIKSALHIKKYYLNVYIFDFPMTLFHCITLKIQLLEYASHVCE